MKLIRFFVIIVVIAISAIQVSAQIVKPHGSNFNADSIRDEFDRGPYFTLYKDNYFTAGTSLGDKPMATTAT